MLDTIVRKCRRPLKAVVTEALRSRTYYQGENWTVTARTNWKPGLDEFHPGFVGYYANKNWHLRVTGQAGNVDTLKVELPCVLYPTNGYILQSQADIDRALATVHEAIDEIAEAGLQSTDTVRMDVVMNLRLPPDILLNALRSVRLLGIHAWPELFEDVPSFRSSPQTVQWKGKEVWLTIYNKTKLTCKNSSQHYDEERGCVRIELRLLKKGPIARFLGDKSGGPITSLDFFSLYRNLRHVLQKFPCAMAPTSKCTLKNLLAVNLAKGFDINGVPVMDWYRQTVGRARFARVSREITGRALSFVGIDFSKILPPIAPPEMVHVTELGTLLPAYDPSWGPRRRIVRQGPKFVLQEVPTNE